MRTCAYWIGLAAACGLGAAALRAAGTGEVAAVPAARAKEGGDRLERLLAEGKALLLDNNWTGAVAKLTAAYEVDPKNPRVRFWLGSAFSEGRKFQRAMLLLEPLMQEMPDNPLVLNNVAWIHAKAADPAIRNPEKAVLIARDALLIAPQDYHVWGTLAEAYFAAKRFDRADRSARIALRVAQEAGARDGVVYQELFERCKQAAEATAVLGAP